MLQALAFPTTSLGATVLAVGAVGYVLNAAAPAVRSSRDAQRAFSEVCVAMTEVENSLTALVPAIEAAKAAVQVIDVEKLEGALDDIDEARAKIVDTLDLMFDFVESHRRAVRALRRMAPFANYFGRRREEFKRAIGTFVDTTKDVLDLARAEHEFRSDGLAQFDVTREGTVRMITARVMQKARDLAASRGRVPAADALETLRILHDEARMKGTLV